MLSSKIAKNLLNCLIFHFHSNSQTLERSHQTVASNRITPKSFPSDGTGQNKCHVEVRTVDECTNTVNVERARNKSDENESFQAFGNFVAETLRKIPNKSDANKIERKLQRTLLELLEELDAKSSMADSSSNSPINDKSVGMKHRHALTKNDQRRKSIANLSQKAMSCQKQLSESRNLVNLNNFFVFVV